MRLQRERHHYQERKFEKSEIEESQRVWIKAQLKGEITLGEKKNNNNIKKNKKIIKRQHPENHN